MAAPGNNAAGTGDSAGGGMGWAAASARRKAIRNSFRPVHIAHGLQHSPMITHAKSGKSGAANSMPQFGLGGGFKAGGF